MVRRQGVLVAQSVVYLTIADVMARLQVSRPTVYKYFQLGLPRYKVGKSVRVSPVALDKWLSMYECGLRRVG
jgi:excisionase family DNA binding protein